MPLSPTTTVPIFSRVFLLRVLVTLPAACTGGGCCWPPLGTSSWGPVLPFTAPWLSPLLAAWLSPLLACGALATGTELLRATSLRGVPAARTPHPARASAVSTPQTRYAARLARITSPPRNIRFSHGVR